MISRIIAFTALTTCRAQVWIKLGIAVGYTIFLDLLGFADVALVLRQKGGDKDCSIRL